MTHDPSGKTWTTTTYTPTVRVKSLLWCTGIVRLVPTGTPKIGARMPLEWADMYGRSRTPQTGSFMESALDSRETGRWLNWVPTFVWRIYETVAGVPATWQGRVRQSELPQRVPSGEVGEMGPSDWLGTPILVGSKIVYPSEAYGSNTGPGRGTKQMTLATVLELRSNGLTVSVDRRSRTGRPNGEYERTKVRLTAVGIANLTVIA